MADLQAKYQILAAEYSKLKAQIPVLKKAYLDEQIETEKLKDLIKERDQSVRKYEQEVDSLSFRNQQLTKRVLFLQDELEHTESSKKKNKHKDNEVSRHDDASQANSVLSEELHSKIEENALLHKKVHEATSQYEGRISDLEHRLKTSETDHSQHEEVLNATRQKSKAQIDKLQEEKAMLEVKLQTYDTELKDFRVRAELAEEKLETLQKNLQSKLDCANKIIADKLPFIDTKNRDLNRLNIPTHDRKHQMRARELVNQSSNLVGELVQGLSNFYTYSEQRSKIYPADGVSEPHSAINTKYCKYLHENMAHLRPVEQSIRLFSESLKEDSLTTLETATDLQLFSKNFQNLVAYMNRLLPYQLSSIEEECAVSSCTSTLAAKNMELFKSLKRLTSVFNKLETYVTVLGAQSKTGMIPHPQSSHVKFFSQLIKVLNDLHDAVKDVSKHYNSKVSLEHQLPTATQKLKTTDECVVASLVSLVTNTGKFSAFMSGNMDFFSQSAGYRTRGSSVGTDLVDGGPRSHPAVVGFKVRSSKYLASLERPCPESVPHKVAVQNRKTLLSSTENKQGLTHQISVFQQRVNKLDQEKEHWMLELQLLKIKYENELTKTKQQKLEIERLQKAECREDSIEDNMDTTPSVVTSAASTPSVSSTQSVQTTMLGSVTCQSESSDIDSREELIKNHYTSRISELSLQLQALDSKCVNFHAEVRALHKQLQLAQKSKCAAIEELKTSNQSLAQLKDELQTTSRSYDGQLSMMSDHLAGMNEKLTQQKDEIDDLKMQLQSASSKSHKKNKK
ncbi:protein phosphatase 1 regulatory subunit 21-like [Gigantopelta aegis]|uniref:protein phosphatase 1 regulatory subunit 21-like n=1 Tax=Gigantopelta aegis TaxID=1735272 RepID=UPI001B88C574|nr:protein phosphatase 1 regulatory subunit 21-like [Gigantopelta aegis]